MFAVGSCLWSKSLRFKTVPNETNRIYHRSPTQGEKCKSKSKQILQETRFTEFPALSVDPRVGISRSATDTDEGVFSYLLLKKNMVFITLIIFFNLVLF